MKKIRLILIGFFLIMIDLPIHIGPEYGFYHIKNEPIMRNIFLKIFNTFMGHNYYVDILPDVIGYGILIYILGNIKGLHKRFEQAGYAAIIGAAGSVVMMLVTFLPLDIKEMVYFIAVLKVVKYFTIIVLVFYVGKGIYSLIDGYMYLELWKDIKYCWDIIAMAPLFIYPLGVLSIFGIKALSWLAMVFYAAWLYAALLYLYTIYSYSKKLRILDK